MNQQPSGDEKKYRRELLLAVLMFAWIVGLQLFGFVEKLKHSGDEEYPAMAHFNLLRYFIFTASFLIASFIGGCSTIRLIRSGGHTKFPAVIGWLWLLFFAMIFFFSCYVTWLDYKTNQSHVVGAMNKINFRFEI
jgi:hypothetical protein